jgi:Prenyltransferase and squalene oxidase repeat
MLTMYGTDNVLSPALPFARSPAPAAWLAALLAAEPIRQPLVPRLDIRQMRSRFLLCVAMAALGVVLARRVWSDEPPAIAPAPAATRQAVERSLVFLEQDALKWRQERECSTCHHGAMTVWALTEAKERGYAVHADTLTQMVAWTKARLVERLDQPRDARPGWNLVNLSAMYMASLAQAVPQQDAFSADELRRIAAHVARHQEADGFWSVPQPRNGPPPVFESAEVYTLWAYLALRPHAPADPQLSDSSNKAAAWLSKTQPSDSTQAAALRLLVEVNAGTPPAIDRLLERQNADGGFGQVKDSASDAFATGQALYVLSLAGVKGDRMEIQRAVAFLVASQREDGSWPMTSRAQPGEKPFTNPVPITYFGSAWATLGLIRAASR